MRELEIETALLVRDLWAQFFIANPDKRDFMLARQREGNLALAVKFVDALLNGRLVMPTGGMNG